MRYFINRTVSAALLVVAIVGLSPAVSVAQTVKPVAIRATVVDDAGKAKDGVQLELYKKGNTTGNLSVSKGGGYVTFPGVEVATSDIYELKVGATSAKDWQAVYLNFSPNNDKNLTGTKTCPSCLFSVPGTKTAANPTGDRYVKVGLRKTINSELSSLIVDGYVKDADGKTGGIKNATVTGTGGIQTPTDSDGKYTLSFNNLKLGSAVTLTAVAAGYLDKTESITFGSDTVVHKDILMQKGDGSPPPPPKPKPKIGVDSRAVTHQEIERGKKATGQWFQVKNDEVGSDPVLNYTVSKDVEWLTLTGAVTGSSRDANDSQRVNIIFPTAAHLEVGDYNATLTISDANATNSPQTVNVSLKVIKPVIKFGDVWHSLIYGNVYDKPEYARNYCNRTKGVNPQNVRPKMNPPYGISIVGIAGNITINPEFYNSWQCVALPEQEDGKYKSVYKIKYKTDAVPSTISMLADEIKDEVPSGADEDLGSVEVTPSSALGKDGKPTAADVRFYAYGDLFGKHNIDPKIQPIPIDYVKMRINIFDKIVNINTAVEKVPTKTRGGVSLGSLKKINIRDTLKKAAEKFGAEEIAKLLGKDKDAAQKPTYADGFLVLTRTKTIRDKYLSSATISQAEFEALKMEINLAEDIFVYTSKAPIDTWLWAKEPSYPFFVFANLAPNTTDPHVIAKLQEVDLISSEQSAGAPPQTSQVKNIEPKLDANGNLVSIEEYLPKPYADGEQVAPRIVNWIPNTGKQFTEEAE